MNLYAYTHNDPLNYLDPNGEAAVQVLEVAVIAAGAATLYYSACGGSSNPACVAARGLGDRFIGSVRNLFNESSDSGETTPSSAEGESSSGNKPRFIVDGKGEIVDSEATPKGRYQQPDGGRTDVLQDDDHGAGRNHTHRPKTNTNPRTGETFVNGLGEGTPVTEDDVNNIVSGAAKPLPPRGR